MNPVIRTGDNRAQRRQTEVMKFSAAFFFAVSVLLVSLGARAELDAVYTNPGVPVRAPASTWPEEIEKEFIVSAPERAPASVRPNAKKQAKTKGQAAPVATASTPGRRSRLPATVRDGFEIRVRFNNLTTMIWVMERGGVNELVFANSAGSRAMMNLSAPNFEQMQSVARGIVSRLPASEGNISKCREASMQMHVRIGGGAERTITLCVNDKGKPAEALRNLSQSIAALVK